MKRLLCTIAVGVFLFPLRSQALDIDGFTDGFQVLYQVDSSSTFAAPSILGGNRALVLDVKAGHTMAVGIFDGILDFAEGSNDIATATIIWDGDSNPSAVNAAGLSVNLLEDGSNAFQVETIAFDFAFDKPIYLTFIVYDRADPSGAKFSSGTFTINEAVTDPAGKTFQFPFAQMTTSGQGGAADFQNVGAIVLQIEGKTTALDIRLDRVATNGTCPKLPVGGSVFDQCGVCGGDNSSCAGCDGIPNSGKVIDKCGVCGGDGSSCSSCTGVLDQCGVCDGDGTSCIDCSGTPFGGASTDRCGVCAGDGNSCLQCADADISKLLFALDGNSKIQRDYVHRATLLLTKSEKKVNRAQIRKIRTTSNKLYLENWTLAWSLPRINTSCADVTFCIKTDLSGTVKTYNSNSRMLRDFVRKISALHRGSNKKRLRKLVKKAGQTYKENQSISDQVPLSHTECS